MREAITNEEVSFDLLFLTAGEFVTPDENSITLTLRKSDGTILSGLQDFPLPTLTPNTAQLVTTVPGDITYSNAVLKLPGSLNTIGSTSFETRFVCVKFKVEGASQEYSFPYVLRPFIPLLVTKEDVRSLLGAKYQEVPDSEVDLFQNYQHLVTEYGLTFTEALTTDSTSTLAANNAVALRTALGLLPGLPAKLTKIEANSDASTERGRIDYAVLKENLENAYAAAIATLQGTGTPVTHPLLGLTSVSTLFTS